MSKAKKKIKIRKKPVVIIITTVLCLLLLSGFLIFYLINENKYYKIKSRVDAVEKQAKKDKEEDYDIVGWIRVQGTNIDYPVIYAPDHNFTYDMENFAWTEVDFKKLNNITYIQGHNILNLSKNPLIAEKYHTRFEQLMSFTYLEFVKENKYIQYTFKGKDYLYKIFAVSYQTSSDIDYYNKDNYSKKKMQKYIDNALENSIYDFDIDVNSNDKIISLVTCTRMFGNSISFKVDARLVRNLESVKNYDVKKTKEYSKVEEQMKGGSSNENEV